MAFASTHLWNLANDPVRQSFVFQKTYLNNPAPFHLLKEINADKALPSKGANQVLLQLPSRMGWLLRGQGSLSRTPRAVPEATEVAQLPAPNARA